MIAAGTSSLDELKSVVMWIQQQTSGLTRPADRRARMALGCLDLAIEYQAGIPILADQPYWGPTFALVRCLLDAFIRGAGIATGVGRHSANALGRTMAYTDSDRDRSDSSAAR
jgi:hypothetical protein